jgi:tetratricopeptide (TPR) repeat protein
VKVQLYNHSICLLLTGVLLVSIPSFAQRKKKAGDETQASGIKLREAEFYFTEGEKFFILEDYSKALLYFQRTMEISPENATVHYKIAEVLARSNRQEDMLKASISIENALKLEKKNKYFYLLAANIYNSMTSFDKAAAVYETMIREVKGTEEYLYELAAVYQ